MIKFWKRGTRPQTPAQAIAELVGLARRACAQDASAIANPAASQRQHEALACVITRYLESGADNILHAALELIEEPGEGDALATALRTLIRRLATTMSLTDSSHTFAQMCCIPMHSRDLDYASYARNGPDARMLTQESFEMLLNSMSGLRVMGDHGEARGLRLPVPLEWLIGMEFSVLHALTRALHEAVEGATLSKLLRVLDAARKDYEAGGAPVYSGNVVLLFLHSSGIDVSPFSALELASADALANPASLSGEAVTALAQQYAENQLKWAALATRIVEGGMTLLDGTLDVYPPTYLLGLFDDFPRLRRVQTFVDETRTAVGSINPKNVVAHLAFRGAAQGIDEPLAAIVVTFAHHRSGKTFGVARYRIADLEHGSATMRDQDVQTVKGLLARAGIEAAQVVSENSAAHA